MSFFQVIAITAFLGRLLLAVDGPTASAGNSSPVLKRSEPADSVLVTLPGPPAPPAQLPPPAPKSDIAPTPAQDSAKTNAPAAPPAAPQAKAVAPKPPASVELSRNSFLPPDLQKEAALFCQRLIGQWQEEDAEQLLGKPLRSRQAYDEKKAVNGKIYAFADPSGRYRELELDFEQATGTLRTVFAYPRQMSWQECRRRWNGEVSEADARQGRTFYSYLNRRLDVLVDARGRVISLGLY